MPQIRFHLSLVLISSIVILTFTNSVNSQFVHPGLLHSKEDLDRMKKAVAKKQNPIYKGFLVLAKSPFAQANYKMRGPFVEWGRAPNIRSGEAESDARAAYQNALMWAITNDKAHAKKSIQIINAWAGKLKKVSGIDGVLAAGLQGLQFVNAAEILRYTDSGWKQSDAKHCEQWFKKAWYPTIKHYAYFANGNWETAALQTNMSIAVYCNDREMFEGTVRYAVNGAGNGRITHTIVYPTGQCQETTRAQHYAQLGLGLLGGTAEVAWQQGVDLYGWKDNRILKGFEYTAKYGLGENVPYQHYLDRTGKYGIGGRNNNYNKISTKSRGGFWPIFERTYHHYANRRLLSAPYCARVVKKKRPEGHSNDHVGLGTLTHFRKVIKPSKPTRPPGVPAGLVARTTPSGVRLTWVRSIEPLSCTDAKSYTLLRANELDGPFKKIASQVSKTHYEDKKVIKGNLYYYKIIAENDIGESGASATLSACAALPGPWLHKDVGDVGVAGYTEYDGNTFTLEGEGSDIGGKTDSFHFTYAPMKGEGTITARIVLPMSSQWTKPGVMMRKSLAADSPHASVLLLPHWSGALVTRIEKGGDTTTTGARYLGKPHIIKKNRLMTPYWVRLIRFRNTFTGYLSSNGHDWKKIDSAEIDMGHTFYVGLPACSQLKNVTSTVTYDSVSIPTWRMSNGDNLIASRPEPRWSGWMKRHNSINDRVKKGNVDLIMLGDSITHWYEKEGRKVWQQYYAKRNAVNMAISGDRTEHVLWRLENGNVDGISPKLAILMIGTNNHLSSPPQTTAKDIKLIVKTLRKKLPKTKILVLAIFPRGANDSDGARQTNMKVNRLIANIGNDNTGKEQMVHYLNINEAFLTNRRNSKQLMHDFTHLTEKGYAVWAKAMESKVSKLMGEK